MKNKIIKLNNGGTLIYKKSKLSNSTAVEVGFSVGANNDKKPGTAHFLEHMLFKKTKNRTNLEINNDRNKIAFLNASTGLDFVVVKFSRTNKLIESAFEFASDILVNSSLSDEYISSEKGVICEELKMTLDREVRDIFTYGIKQASKRAMFASNIVGGKEENIQKITLADLQKFKEKHFVGNNFIVSVVSSLSLAKIKKLVNKYFVSKIEFNKNYQKQPSYFETAKIDKNSSLKVYDLKQEKVSALISIKFNKCEQDIFEKNLNYTFITRYLSGSQGKLFFRLRNRGLVYRFGCDYTCFKDHSLLNINFESSADKIKDIIEEIKVDIHDLVHSKIDEKNIEEYKNNLLYVEDEKMPTDIVTESHLNLIDFISSGKVFEMSKKAKRKVINNISADGILKASRDIFNKNTTIYVSLLGKVKKQDIQSLETIKDYFLIWEK